MSLKVIEEFEGLFDIEWLFKSEKKWGQTVTHICPKIYINLIPWICKWVKNTGYICRQKVQEREHPSTDPQDRSLSAFAEAIDN